MRFKNRTFLAFAYRIRLFISETKKFEEFKNVEKALVKSKILDRLVTIQNVVA